MTTNRKTSFKTVSDFIDLGYFQLICQILAKFSGVKSEMTVFKFRKSQKKRWCVHMFIKRTREIRKFVGVVVLPKLIAFLPFSLPSPLPKLSIVLIQKFCYHGNMTLHLSSLFWNTFCKTDHNIHLQSNGLTRFGFFPVSYPHVWYVQKNATRRSLSR